MQSRNPIPTALVSCIAVTSALLLTSCSTSVNLVEVIHGEVKRHREPEPEATWNRMQLWQRVADDPPTYIPTGYGVSAPRTVSEGTWLVDERDGKRMFVPKTKVGDNEPGVLIGEATKITSPSPREYLHTSPGIMRDGVLVPTDDFLNDIPQSR
jgi:hypothetical protein